jgi:response regulator RpfG family c-di-GMP phosphodiesterase
MSRTIMVVDDEKMITTTLSTMFKLMLKENVIAYNDVDQALACAELENNRIDLIISDFMMPKMNGLEFLKNVREKCPGTVTILLTGYADKENAIKSINEIGLYYYLEKPWDNNDLIKVVKNGLEKKVLEDDLKAKYEELEKSNQEITRLYELLKHDYNTETENTKNLVITLANVIEAKDKYTDGHTRRVGMISRRLGEKLGLPEEKLNSLETAGLIHDIGKVGVPESILNKPDKLTPEEFDIIKKHSEIGETIIKPLSSLHECLVPVRSHHEKLNGSGYPDGLKGEEITTETRILCVSDIFDALYSDRPYRGKLTLPVVKDILKKDVEAGCLDAKVVEALFEMIDNGSIEEIFA